MEIKLRQIRTMQNLSQEKLAAEVGVSLTTYQYYEAGKRFPTICTAIKLAQILKSDVSDIWIEKNYGK